MPAARKPGVALLSDQIEFRHAVSKLLANRGLEPLVEIDEPSKLVAAAQRRPIDIAIIDLDHASEPVLDVVKALRNELPELLIIAIAIPPVRPAAVDAIGDTPEEVDREALVTSLVHGFRAAAADKPPHRNWSRITSRQRDVMRWLATGLDNAGIGQKLHIGERAVKAHISSLLALFSLENRTQLALLADRAGLRPPRR
jgi:DNA-binding NarL/FixJ family response regulator